MRPSVTAIALPISCSALAHGDLVTVASTAQPKKRTVAPVAIHGTDGLQEPPDDPNIARGVLATRSTASGVDDDDVCVDANAVEVLVVFTLMTRRRPAKRNGRPLHSVHNERGRTARRLNDDSIHGMSRVRLRLQPTAELADGTVNGRLQVVIDYLDLAIAGAAASVREATET